MLWNSVTIDNNGNPVFVTSKEMPKEGLAIATHVLPCVEGLPITSVHYIALNGIVREHDLIRTPKQLERWQEKLDKVSAELLDHVSLVVKL